MKAYKIELLVVDSSDIGLDMIKHLLESSLILENAWVYCETQKVTSANWQDEILLDKKSTTVAEYRRLFG